jgi:para-nitrobenzyl esterase
MQKPMAAKKALTTTLDRRRFLQQAMLACAATQTPRLLAESSASAEVATAQGTLRGELADGIRVFRGVPFAQPPVGELRFRPPAAPQPWTGVREAMQFAPAALQPGGSKQSEDCLYLNVWAQAGATKQPVLVWVHGGGFVSGRASDMDGAVFARDGVICVTVAYRLGVLGFLDVSPALGDSYRGSANNGVRDLMASLTWVQQNIAAFGGDPAQVTVGGESAGAKLSDILLGVPAAQGLFQQVISESGGAERCWLRDEGVLIGETFAKLWTKAQGGPASAMKTASAAQILAAQESFDSTTPVHFPLRPEADGSLIPRLPQESVEAGMARSKRLLIGTNRDESAFFIGPHPNHDPGSQELGNQTLAKYQAIESGYRKAFPRMSDEQRRIRSLTAEEYLVPSIQLALAQAKGGGTAFVYRLDFPGIDRFEDLTPHTYDLRFVWERFPSNARPDALRLEQEMHTAWVAFLKGQAPAAPGLPAWPEYTAAAQPTMLFDARSTVVNDPNAAEFAIWGSDLLKTPLHL